MTLVRELRGFGDAVGNWIWHIPITLFCIFGTSLMGYEVPAGVFVLLFAGVIFAYCFKRFTRPRFHDVPELIELFKHESDLACLNAGEKILDYVTDPKDGYQNQYIAVRNKLGEALQVRIISKNDEICLLSIRIAEKCAQHPKNVLPLAKNEIVARCLWLLNTHRNEKIVAAACHTVTTFCEDERCRKELGQDVNLIKAMAKLVTHSNFLVVQEACTLGATIMTVSPMDKKKDFVFKYKENLIKDLTLLLTQIEDQTLVLSVCSLLGVLLVPSGKASDSDYFEKLVEKIIENKGIEHLCLILATPSLMKQLLHSACTTISYIFEFSDFAKNIAKENDILTSLKGISLLENQTISKAAANTLNKLK